MKKLMIELKQHVKAYFPIFGMCFAFSFCIYYLLISQGLVNSDDGLWEYDYYKGGRWVISLGRWFIPYLDRLRFGFSMEPATSLITLGLYSLGLMFVLDLLDVGAKRKSGLLACALFMSSVVVCVSLSFRFTSPNYGMAFLLNTAAVWVAVKGKNIFGMLAGGIMIALGMGTYQAYIGCACLVFTGYVMKALGEEQKSMRSILAEIFRFAGMMLTGAILYVLVLNIHLKFFYISMAEYNGAENYSLINTLRSLPFSIPYAYRTFFRYFLGDMAKLNLLQGAGIFILFYVLGGVIFAGNVLRIGKISRVRAVLFLVMAALVPLACNAMLLVATNSHVSLHMAGGMALCVPVLMCVECGIYGTGRLGKYLWKLNLLVVVFILYGNIYQVQVDQEAMLSGRTAVTTLAEMNLNKLDETGNLDSDAQYCIVGSPNRNSLYYFSRTMEHSNQYAMFGVFNSSDVCTRRSWQGTFNYLCGVELNICPAWEYDTVRNDPVVQNMPLFPEEGSILRMEDKIVVKVSE